VEAIDFTGEYFEVDCLGFVLLAEGFGSFFKVLIKLPGFNRRHFFFLIILIMLCVMYLVNGEPMQNLFLTVEDY
jgi:hypothetical protein